MLTNATKLMAIHEQINLDGKRTMVKRHRGPIDLNPVLVVTFADGAHHVGMAVPDQMGPEFNLPAAILIDVARLWAKHKGPRIDRIILMADTFLKKFDVDQEGAARATQHGDLERDFRENPDSKVIEAIVTTAVWRDDDVYRTCVIASEYVISDGNQFKVNNTDVGDEIVITSAAEDDNHGAVVLSMCSIMRMSEGEN